MTNYYLNIAGIKVKARSNTGDTKAVLGIFGGMFAVIHLVSGVVSGFAMGYVVHHWIAYLNKPDRWSWWYGAMLGAIPFFGPYVSWFSVAAAVVTFVASFFL